MNNEIGTNKAITVARGDLYIISSDTTPGLYKYGSLFPGLPKGFHKITTRTNNGTAIDEIYTTFLHSLSDKLFISYRAGSTYGIDYIDLNSKETAGVGTLVTDVFSSNTSFEKKPKRIRFATSNTSGTKTIKLYFRINNGSWELDRTINTTTNTIQRVNISTINNKNIDIQFKVELTNPDKDDTPPTLHDLTYDYTIIET